mmetsp:Transcript_59678/g.121673  ORF Transcript_59678/g.121673 Transcript_59678/m.121673 type:complete len:534 (+) Transcript_59678:151-1752(+)
MEELALMPKSPELMELTESYEPIAEHNLNRKRVLQLEQGIDKLHRTTRQQHEVVSNLESGMKAMISETDLRRAIGIAFQEFEHRLEDAFQDSNRKCLTMFSKRDEVQDLQVKISNKVNWSEHNTVLKKLSELRQYIDTMAESVFIGHRDALNGEFAKKADASMVEKALKAKADFDDVNEVRARLERLEVLVSQTDMQQSAKLKALHDETVEMSRAQSEKQEARIVENATQIKALSEKHTLLAKRLTGDGTPGGGLEGRVGALAHVAESLGEGQELLKNRQEQMIIPAIAAMEDRLAKTEDAAGRMQQDLRALEGDAKVFQETSERKFGDLLAQANASKEHFEFLVQATEMIKRKARETAKATTGKFQEHSEAQETLGQQVAALERQLKRQEREVRAMEGRCSRAPDDGGPMRALPPPELVPADPNDKLKSVLEQLEKIAGGGPPLEQLGVEWNRQKPPLPFGGDSSRLGGVSDGDAVARLPRYDASDPAPIDSARGNPMTSAVRGMYGLSPRGGPGSAYPATTSGPKGPKKKR